MKGFIYKVTCTVQKEAADYFGIASHNISEVINGKRKSAGKYNGNPIYWVKKPLI